MVKDSPQMTEYGRVRLMKNAWKAFSPTLGATPKPTGETQNALAAHLVMVSGKVFSMFTEPLSLQGQRCHKRQRF